MDHLKFYEAGCEPVAGPRAFKVWLRKGALNTLRPIFVRLAEILDRIIARLDAQEQNAAYIDQHVQLLEYRTEALTNELGRLVDRPHVPPEQLRDVHVYSEKQHETHFNRLNTLISQFDALEDKIQTLQAFHWDHVALARRLAILEDLIAAANLNATPAGDEQERHPFIPFPGFDSSSQSRAI